MVAPNCDLSSLQVVADEEDEAGIGNLKCNFGSGGSGDSSEDMVDGHIVPLFFFFLFFSGGVFK